MESRRRVNEGCFVSAVTGFILTFLAILLAVGSGVLVYLIRGPSHVTCTCNCPFDEGPITDHSDQAGRNTTLKYDTNIATHNRSSPEIPDSPKPPEMEVSKSYRLPSSLLPVLYNLEIKPNIYDGPPENFTFEGHEKIVLNCSEETKNITVNLDQLTLINESISISDDSKCASSSLEVISYERDFDRQVVILHLNEVLKPGCQYSLGLSFTGALTNRLSGLFYSSYERSGSTVYLAATFFSPVYARQAFPCFDEPQMKARFAITIVRRPDFVSLSNMEIQKTTTRPDGFVADEYNVSPVMSTYLVAFLVCDYQQKTKYSKGGTKVRVWAPRETLQHGEYALDIGVKLLDFYADYFGVPYMLPKLDLVPVPDYKPRAMENWGLITFVQAALLYDPLYSSFNDKDRIASVIAHEIVHLWFGDLVTMEWWSELWLKEGFATYLEYLGVDHIHKDWNVWDRFVLWDLQLVFQADSLGTSHPIVQPADSPAEIQTLFNYISYSKGSSLMRMMTFMFGEKTYKSALNTYLKSKAYGCSTRFDLWEALQQNLPPAVSLNVTWTLEPWVSQRYYPVVTVTRNGSSLAVSQRKFRSDAQLKPEDSPFGYRWDIPFTYTTSQEKDFEAKRIIYLNRTHNETLIRNIPILPVNNSWIIANIQQYGYYRVNYDVTNWKALIRQLKLDHKVIPLANRAQIINDAWSLAKSGLLDQKIALETTEYLRAERAFVPWKAALIQLRGLDGLLANSRIYGKFKEFMRRLLKPQYKTFKWEPGDFSYSYEKLRLEIVSLACRFGLVECVQKASEYFYQWMKKNTTMLDTVAPGLRSVIYRTAIKHGDDSEWDFVYRKYKTIGSSNERQRLRFALAYSRDTWILKRFLEMALNGSEIGHHDVSSTILGIAMNPQGRELVWEFINTRWSDLQKINFPPVSQLHSMLIQETGPFNTMEEYLKLVSFMTQHPEQVTGSSALMQSAEKILANVHWLTMNEGLVSNWLDQQLRTG